MPHSRESQSLADLILALVAGAIIIVLAGGLASLATAGALYYGWGGDSVPPTYSVIGDGKPPDWVMPLILSAALYVTTCGVLAGVLVPVSYLLKWRAARPSSHGLPESYRRMLNWVLGHD